MRRILVDHARSHARQKRGGEAQRLSLDATAIVSKESVVELVAIDEAPGQAGKVRFAEKPDRGDEILRRPQH